MADLNANKVDDMLDALNEAMEIHAQNAIKNLSFNKTELAEVVDITRRNEGWYIVWNGSTRYMAFSENTSYKMGMKVYVNIPNNDFSSQKTIIGQYKEDSEQAVFFRSPLDGFLPLTDNILENSSTATGEFCLLANCNKETQAFGKQSFEIYRNDSMTYTEGEGANEKVVSPYSGYKYIGISAEVKTLLKQFDTMQGDYGIRIVLEGIQKLDVTENAETVKRVYYLDSKNMIGDIYNFPVYFKQEALFNIEEFDTLSRIIVGVYQGGNFKDIGNENIPYNNDGLVSDGTGVQLIGDDSNDLLPDNIFIKNISIRFGDDDTSRKDVVKLSTLTGKTYDSAQTDLLNRKTIDLEWLHTDPNTEKKIKITSPSDVSTDIGIARYVIHWYQDSIHSATDYNAILKADEEDRNLKLNLYDKWKNSRPTDPDELAQLKNELTASFNLTSKNDWQTSGELTETGVNKIKSALSAASRTSVAADTLAGAFWQPINNGTNRFELKSFLPDYTRAYSKIKVVIEYWEEAGNDDTYNKVESNELQFDNLREVLSVDKNSGLKIGFDDKTGGNYPIYDGITGHLLSRLEESKTRGLTATFLDEKGRDYFNGNEIIIWKIPIGGTMILLGDSFYSNSEKMSTEDTIFSDYDIDYENGYVYIKREAVNSTAPVNSKQSYQIAPYYNIGFTSNTVWCYVIKNNQLYSTSATMTFNQHGTCGTDYTFTLGLGPKIIDETPGETGAEQIWTVVGPSDTALTIGDTYDGKPAYHEILFNLYNAKNEPIELTREQKNVIITSWNNHTSNGYYTGQTNARHLQFILGTGDNAGRIIVRAPDRDIEDFQYIVFQAFVTSDVLDENDEKLLDKVNFVQYYPLHIREKNSDWELNGSDYIVYDDKGANPTCYNDKFELISKADGTQPEELLFKIITDDVETPGSTDNSPETYYPRIVNGKIQPTPLYIGSISKNVALIGIVATGDNLRIAYTCPIVIIENKYQIPAVNNWNGDLQIDTKGNKILASMVGAGHKDNHNTFSGVLMGDVQYKDDYSGEDITTTGLFGYDKSEQTFGFNINGQAFIGKSDVGRIYVDGNTGRITSAARESYDINKAKGVIDNDPRGTEINLKENYIDIQGESTSVAEDTNKSRIHIDTAIRPNNQGGTNAYFSIDSNNGKRLIHIANDEYYLQTEDYPSSQIEVMTQDGGTTTVTRPSGLKIDLKNGSFDSKGKLTITGNSESSINFGNGTFKVDGTGETTLSSLTFKNPNTGVVQATGIKPHWMTFVSDISGSVTLQKVTVTMDNIPVPHTTVTNNYNTYTTYNTAEGTTTFKYVNNTTAGIISNYVDDVVTGDVTGQITGDFSPSASPRFYNHSATVHYSYTVETPVVEGPYKTTTTDTVYVDGKGSTDVPVVTAINFTIKKVSMWALTNDTAQTKTYSINAKGDASYTGEAIVRTMTEV